MRLITFLFTLGCLAILGCGREEGLPQVGSSPDSTDAHALPPLPPPEADYEDAEYRWGFADEQGRLVISDDYDEVRPFDSSGLALVRQNGRWHFINTDGQQAGRNWRAAWPYQDSLARVQSDDDRFGFIAPDGTVVINPTYEAAGDFNEGHAWIRVGGQYGLIDTSGQIAIEPQYEKLSDLNNGRLIFRQAGQYGLRDLEQVLIEPAFERLVDEGDLLRARQNGRYGYLQLDGNWLIEPAYQMSTPFTDERAAVMRDGQWQLINPEGQDYLEEPFQQLFYGGEGRWIVEADGRYGAVDAEGRVKIPVVYGEIQPFSEGLAAFSLDNFWGYLRPDGSQAFPPRFALAWPFRNGFARVATREGIVMIDQTGRIMFPAKYLDLRDYGNFDLVPVQVFR